MTSRKTMAWCGLVFIALMMTSCITAFSAHAKGGGGHGGGGHGGGGHSSGGHATAHATTSHAAAPAHATTAHGEATHGSTSNTARTTNTSSGNFFNWRWWWTGRGGSSKTECTEEKQRAKQCDK